jgi:hypothetical protein
VDWAGSGAKLRNNPNLGDRGEAPFGAVKGEFVLAICANFAKRSQFGLFVQFVLSCIISVHHTTPFLLEFKFRFAGFPDARL